MTSSPIAPIQPPQHRRTIGRLLLVIGVLTSAFILLLSLLLASRLSSEDAILEDMAQVMQSVSNETVENTAGFLAPAERTAAELSNLAAAGYLEFGNTLAPDALFYEVLRVYDSFDGIFMGRADGSFLYVRRTADGYVTKIIDIDDGGFRTVRNLDHDEGYVTVNSSVDPTDDYDPRTRPWYSLAVDAEASGVWTDPYVFFSSGLPGVTRASRAVTPTGEELVVGIDIRIDELSTFIDTRRASDNGASFIIDRQRNVVAYPDKTLLADGSGLVKTEDIDDPLLNYVASQVPSIDGDATQELITASVDGTDYHVALTPLSANGEWVIAVTAPDDDFLGRVRDAQQTSRRLSTVGGISSVAILLAGGFVVNNRYRNERALAESALAAAEARAAERDVARGELAVTVDELARSNADLEQYAYATAHDLRTPLRAMGGYAELLLREADDKAIDPELAGYAHRIVESYERMCLTMDNLLEHARTSVHEPARVSVQLSPILDDALSDFSDEIERIGATVNGGSTPLPEAAVDPIAMHRIFQNLISNSIKYRHKSRPCHIDISGSRDGDTTTVRVTDNGIGIAPEDQERVFKLFSRVSSDDAGTGVGLALVKRLVEEHHGTIDVESSWGDGSTFTITLPSVPSTEHTPDAQPAEANQ